MPGRTISCPASTCPSEHDILRLPKHSLTTEYRRASRPSVVRTGEACKEKADVVLHLASWSIVRVVAVAAVAAFIALMIASSGAQTAAPGPGSVPSASEDGVRTLSNEPLQFFTTSLPDGVAGNLYGYPVNVFGGTMPYAWEVYSGALPDGMSLNGQNLTGIPEAPGESTFTIKVTDDLGATISREFTLTISRSPADVECDYDVDATDALAVLRKLAGFTEGLLPQVCAIEPVLPAGDANLDTEETIADVLFIRGIVADIN